MVWKGLIIGTVVGLAIDNVDIGFILGILIGAGISFNQNKIND